MTQTKITQLNYKTAWLQQTGNLFVADLASTIAEGLVIANISDFDKRFPIVPQTVKAIIEKPLYYFQRPIEAALNYTKNIEGADYYEKRKQMDDNTRLKALTEASYHYGAAIAVGWGGMVGASKLISTLTKSPAIHSGMFAKDMVIHAGLIALISTPMMAGTTEQMKNTVKAVSKSFGADEKKSEDLARIAIFSGVPNYATLGIMSGLMYRDNKLKALQNSLNEVVGAVAHSV